MAVYWTLLESIVTTFFSLLYAAAVLLTSGTTREPRVETTRAHVLRASFERAVTTASVPQDPSIGRRLRAADPAERARAACDAATLGSGGAPLIPDLVAILGDWAAVPGDVCREGDRGWKLGLAEDTSPGEAAAAALVSIGGAAVTPLIGALRAPQWHARMHAAWALGALDDARAIAPLTATLGDAEGPVRRNAAWALGALDARAAVPALVTTLKDRDADTRARAAWALGAIGSDAAVPGLIASLRDSHPRVRSQSAWALGAIGDSRAVGALTTALKDPEAGVRRKAAWALGVIGD